MSEEFGKITCLHCGQRIEYPTDSGVDSVECPTCLFPVPLTKAAVNKTSPVKRSKALIWSTIAVAATVFLLAALAFVHHKTQPSKVQLERRAKESQRLWAKADAGDKAARRALGAMYWNIPTNHAGSSSEPTPELQLLFFDFKSPKVRSDLLNETSDWLSAEKKNQIQTLFHKADAGDKDARGELVMIVLGDVFRMQERMQLRKNAAPQDKGKNRVHSNYSNGFDTTGTDYVAIGTEKDNSAGDEPTMRLERKSYRHETPEYQAQFYLHGRTPIVLSEGNTVRLAVNDAQYTLTHRRRSNASTNATGRSFEAIYLPISPEIAGSFVSAQRGFITFEGDRRIVTFPFTEESLAVFREFAQQCKREDDLISRPVSSSSGSK